MIRNSFADVALNYCPLLRFILRFVMFGSLTNKPLLNNLSAGNLSYHYIKITLNVSCAQQLFGSLSPSNYCKYIRFLD